MTFGSLFSGIGGLDLGLERAGMTCIWQCEIDAFCRRVLAKHWPDVRCYEDVRQIDGTAPAIDLLCGGFPCQPHSVAGKRKGKDDERNLWPECIRLVRLLRPRWCLFENVPGLLTTMFGQVCDELRGAGYEVWALVLGADDVRAPHRRKRVWIICHAKHTGLVASKKRRGPTSRNDGSKAGKDQGRQLTGSVGECLAYSNGSQRIRQGDTVQARRNPVDLGGSIVCNSIKQGLEKREGIQSHNGKEQQATERAGSMGNRTSKRPQGAQFHRLSEVRQFAWPSRPGEPQHSWEDPRLIWPIKPSLGEPANGLSRRLARRRREQLKALGNAVVPQCAELIGRAIMQATGVA